MLIKKSTEDIFINKNKFMNGFENWIKDICKRKHMKLKDVSTKMGVEPASLTRTLKGGNPRLDTLVKLSEALEVEITALIPQEIKPE